ncbi:hypothetical protein Acr_25g0006570 [Actinidia rufa]|uniref:Uncharacterized protein n=1 Tax=Actinidia rufa TaxID=165716 RepID=A0A7J0GZU1_9ERIC|nr:hypothetical protein Acr_25g0006570 [Actinidia rufa]
MPKMYLLGSFLVTLGLLVPMLQVPFQQILKNCQNYGLENGQNWSLSSGLDAIVVNKMKDNVRDSKDFLLHILRARESETVSRNVFTAGYISAAAYEHLLGGSSTNSYSIIYLGEGNPEVEKKLLEEIDGFGPFDQIPTANDLQL